MSVVVVTDSSVSLPAGYAEQYGIHVVPLYLSVDGGLSVAEPDFGSPELAAAFRRRRRITTSGASMAELVRVYRQALDGGAEGVVSVHLSRRLSGTWDAARLAAQRFDRDRVRVVDSRSTGMGLGFPVLAAVNAARRGAFPSTVEDVAVEVAAHTDTFLSVQTLEYLRRGGRIGAASAVVGTALAIKPLLRVQEGTLEGMEKVRTSSKAMSRLVEIAERTSGNNQVDIAVQHFAVPERAAELVERLSDQFGSRARIMVSELGSVIGAHVGPGALGVVVSRGKGV